ncbi:MAG: exodeoxyribonuclease V subunit gamma, partial [Acidimicrobiia bacterium]|nr:exodeoxyribonuclease V subunit gamma [Acidimicrobiia bacterium]
PGRSDGIAANIAMPLPSELRRLVLTAAGADLARGPNLVGGSVALTQPPAGPWHLDRLVWQVLAVLSRADLPPRAAALGRPGPGTTRYGLARTVADLFDRYHQHRPEMVRRWASGDDVDGRDAALRDSHRWQPELWRLLRATIGEPSPPELLAGAAARIREGRLPLELPGRLALFGLTTLAPDLVELLDALAEQRQVELFALAPSPALARKAVDGARRAPRTLFVVDDTAGIVAAHPLAATWSRPSLETAWLLGSRTSTPVALTTVAPAVAAPAETVLARLQADIAADDAPRHRHRLQADDRSVGVHGCAGPARQVEVLRDAICHLLAADGSLEERDIVVLCPRIEVFAPYLEAVWGPSAPLDDASSVPTGPDDAPPALRYVVTDRALRGLNPLAAAVAALVELAEGRFTASDVVEFLGADPVRARFGLADDDLNLVAEWVHQAGVRWGLDAPHRQPWGLPTDFEANSWRAGLHRVAMGFALDGADVGPGGVVALAVEGDEVALAGRLCAAVDELAEVLTEWRAPTTLPDWLQRLSRAADRLLQPPADAAWQRRRFDAALAALSDAAGPAGDGVALALADLRRLLGDVFAGEPARARFGTGAITVCSPAALRSVPFRVVCLLGLDESALSTSGRSGDDLVAQHRHLGDRDPRAEDRQVLLDALMSAGDHLIVVHDDLDVQSNQKVPAAVVLEELWEALEATVSARQRAQLRDQLGRHHPRQSVAASNFEPAAPWSFDGLALAGARARQRRVIGPALPLVAHPLEARPADPVDLADLVRTVRDPAGLFCDQRLQIGLSRPEVDASDLLPVTIEALDRWQLGGQLLDAVRRDDATGHLERLRSTGALPPGALGESYADELLGEVAGLWALAAELGVDLPAEHTHDVDVTLDAGTRIVGAVGGCVDGVRPGPVVVAYQRPNDGITLQLWIQLLALTAAAPGLAWRAVAVTRAERGTNAAAQVLQVRAPEPSGRAADALDALGWLTELYQRARCEPLPIPPGTAACLARGQISQAAGQWFTARQDGLRTITQGDRTRDTTALLFGQLDFDDLVETTEARPLARELWRRVEATVEIDVLPRKRGRSS